MLAIDEVRDRLLGRRFTRFYRLDDRTDATLYGLLGGRVDRSERHPLLSWVVPFCGLPFEDVERQLELPEGGQVVFAGGSVENHRPFELGATYRVDSTIASIERKRGRRTGTFDAVTFVMTVYEAHAGRLVCETTHTEFFGREVR